MSKRKTEIQHTVRRESANRKEGVRDDGAAVPSVIRTPMVKGKEARQAEILALLRREGVLPN